MKYLDMPELKPKVRYGYLKEFLKESLMIEGIKRDPTPEEITATLLFLDLIKLTLADVSNLVKLYEPTAVLRDTVGLNVKVGIHRPLRGGIDVKHKLEKLLEAISDRILVNEKMINPFEAHCEYEILHPYTDGNGRSGRAIWLWHMLHLRKTPSLDFLHHFYYQTLDAAR